MSIPIHCIPFKGLQFDRGFHCIAFLSQPHYAVQLQRNMPLRNRTNGSRQTNDGATVSWKIWKWRANQGNYVCYWQRGGSLLYSTTRPTAALSRDDDDVDKQQEQRAEPVTVTRSRFNLVRDVICYLQTNWDFKLEILQRRQKQQHHNLIIPRSLFRVKWRRWR